MVRQLDRYNNVVGYSFQNLFRWANWRVECVLPLPSYHLSIFLSLYELSWGRSQRMWIYNPWSKAHQQCIQMPKHCHFRKMKLCTYQLPKHCHCCVLKIYFYWFMVKNVHNIIFLLLRNHRSNCQNLSFVVGHAIGDLQLLERVLSDSEAPLLLNSYICALCECKLYFCEC